MPSTIVHLALAGTIAAVLLGEAFDKKSLGIVLVVTAIPDLDSFLAWFTAAGHRVALHNAIIPLVAGAIFIGDLYLRSESTIRRRWGKWGVRVIGVCIICYLFAHVALDMTDGIVNLFWPVYDQFYMLDGRIELSDQRGIVQTFSDDGIPLLDAHGTIRDVRLTTGVDPGPAVDGEKPERLFPVFRAGWQLVIFVIGTGLTAARFVLPYEIES
jgi:inner membrane protein